MDENRVQITSPSTSPILTIVPGQPPITLAAYDQRFSDYYARCELQTKKWMCETIGEEWVCIDAGASIGYFSILMSRLASRGQVFAFEPTSTTKLLRENLRVNRSSNVEVVEAGVGARTFEGVERVYQTWGEDPLELRASFTTIDDFVRDRALERVDIIKIDVDGFDLEALWGAEWTLRTFSPLVVVELNHALATRGHSVSDALQWMLDQRYSSAIVLDRENFAFSKPWRIGEPWPRTIDICFDNREPLADLRPSIVPGSETDLEYRVRVHDNNGSVLVGESEVSIDGPAWHYAADVRLRVPLASDQVVEVEFELFNGSIGVFCSVDENLQIHGSEQVLDAPGVHRIAFQLVDGLTNLVFRKTTERSLRFRILRVVAGSANLRWEPSRLASDMHVAELTSLIGESPSQAWSNTPLGHVRSISPRELADLLCSRFDPPPNPKLADASELIMERDDAPLLAWLYRTLDPDRHFEFGTWEGFGTTLCLKNCGASVWTVNLGEGEDMAPYPVSREPDYNRGQTGYSRARSDAGKSVGWMYRSEGMEDRVTQVLSDSRDLSEGNLPKEGFGTIFIDGGHQREVVAADQALALKIVNADGVIIWHDFSLDSTVISELRATHGVIAAVADGASALTRDRDLLWVEGSLVLLALPRPTHGES